MTDFEDSALEALVDAYGVAAVLGKLADICAAKSAHTEESWQDNKLAKCWQYASAAIEGLTGNTAIQRVSV